MRNDRENIIVEKTFDLALKIIHFSEELNANKKFIFANQLFKSGTSIGANVKEAQNAESKPDFIHKMKIAAKEADETEYWLKLAGKLKYEVNDLISECNQVQLILSKIISSSIKSLNNNPDN